MFEDIDDILKRWKYDPRENLRIIRGDDGSEKLQVRVGGGGLEGILQMYLDGRTDGEKPHGFEFLLDFYKHSLAEHRAAHKNDAGFTLSPKDCEEIFEESLKIYNRYVLLLQLNDYERVVRDTERNMEVFRFVNRYAATEKDRLNLERWWPYILRINATARAMVAVQNDDYGSAQSVIGETIEKIDRLEEVPAQEFHVERERSLEILRELEESLVQQIPGEGAVRVNEPPKTELERLKEQLQRAVDKENYRLAAELRDRIQGLKDRQSD